MKPTHLSRILVLLATLVLTSACGGGGGGSSSSPLPNSPPAASFTASPASGTAPLTVQFDASASSDSGGSIASHSWHFGDNTAAESGMTISHVFQAGGTYTVTLTVTDNLGATGSTTRTVTVSNISVPNVVGLTQGAATTAIVAAGLTVGSITSATSATVPTGSVISQSPLAETPVSPGTSVNLVISTGTGLPPPVNRPPMISGNPPTSVAVGQTYTFQPTASDPDGQGLTFFIANKPSWASFESFGGRLHGIPTSSDLGTFSNIVITVSDGTASVSLPAFSITVSETASPYSAVHAFITGAEGTHPYDGVIGDAAGNLYGTTRYGGNLACSSRGCGTVFRVDPSGNLLTLHAFGDAPTDGIAPSGLLARDAAGNLYGTTQVGGVNGAGTVFKLDAAGYETVLHHFTGGEGGAIPKGVLRDSNGNLYGVTIGGGFASPNRPGGCGTVFRLQPDGTFTTLHRFAADGTEGCGANGLESAGTQSGLITDAAGNLYGTRYNGGTGDGEHGTVFRIDAAGVFTTLYDFAGNPDDIASHLVARHPGGPLMRDDAGNLYGVTEYGGRGVAEHSGDDSGGIIFRLDPEGEISILHEFALTDRYDGWPYSRAPGGTAPSAGLVGDPAGLVYGTTQSGGDATRGIVYRFDMRSHALDVLHTFTGAQGGRVAAPLVRDSAGVLYGTTPRGGDLACNPPVGCGTVFRIY